MRKSMSRMKFFIVDVFATKKYTGNQVAVIECDEPLEVELMQNIARELSLPEVSFVLASSLNAKSFGMYPESFIVL